MEKTAIVITGLRFIARHGVMEQEQTVGNEFSVDVRLVYPAYDAVMTDRIDATLNYADACTVIRQVMEEPSALLENVCGRLRSALVNRFPKIESGYVRVAKLCPPIPNVQLESVAVELIWDNE